MPNPAHNETRERPRRRAPRASLRGRFKPPTPNIRLIKASLRLIGAALCSASPWCVWVLILLASACSPSPHGEPPSTGWACPAGAIVPHLAVHDVALAVDFYQRALGATSEGVLTEGDALMKVGEAHFVVTSGDDDDWLRPPARLGGTSTGLLLYVPDADALSARALRAGATSRMSPQHAWWGDRYAQVIDPFGHRWGIATRIEAPDESILAKRAAAAIAREPWGHLKAPRAVEFRPPAYPTLIAVLVAGDAQAAASHYRRALGARSALSIPHPEGGVLHEDLRVGASVLMLDQAADFLYPKKPEALGGATVSLMFCLEGFESIDRDRFGYPWRGPAPRVRTRAGATTSKQE